MASIVLKTRAVPMIMPILNKVSSGGYNTDKVLSPRVTNNGKMSSIGTEKKMPIATSSENSMSFSLPMNSFAVAGINNKMKATMAKTIMVKYVFPTKAFLLRSSELGK